jgi:hypothetical protein
VLDVATTSSDGEDDAGLPVFVDRLAAAGTDQSTAAAQAQIRRSIGNGATPPGLRRLAEALAASVTELPPPPRRPSDDTSSVVAAMRDNGLVVLEDHDATAVASAVAALLADGRRVIVTGATPAELSGVRRALPAEAADRALTHLPALSPAELRELRRLLATSTPERRARGGQQLPPEQALPPAAEVAGLCAEAEQPGVDTHGARMVPMLIAGLDEQRRAAVTSVARCAQRTLGELPSGAGQEWPRRLLAELIYSRHRATFDRMLEDTAQAMAAAERIRTALPVTFAETLPPGAIDVLCRFRDYLASGGRARSLFRSTVQREVRPLLNLVRVGPRAPETEEDVRLVIEHLELADRRGHIDAGCAELGVPAPRDDSELLAVADGLVKVAAAARSVGALRHDVLFLAPDSPLSVPDVDAAEEVAGAIIEIADHGSSVEATHILDGMADELEALAPGSATAPEHEAAVAALRRRDAGGYEVAVEAMGAARREARDEERRTALLQRLAEDSPRLAAAWTALAAADPTGLGLVSFLPAATLLAALPPADTADIVLVLGAAELGVDRLLLTAVAPRMIAVVGPGARRDDAPTLLSVLQRASALVIRGRPAKGGRVIPINVAANRAVAAPVGQAGA